MKTKRNKITGCQWDTGGRSADVVPPPQCSLLKRLFRGMFAHASLLGSTLVVAHWLLLSKPVTCVVCTAQANKERLFGCGAH